VPFYEFDVTSPAQTLESAPTELLAGLNTGVVTHVAVQIPRGCVGLVHAQIWRGDFQVWPTNPDGDIKGDNAIIDWDDEYAIDDAPTELRLRVWNDDDSYAHTLTFRFDLLPLDQAQARSAGHGLIARVAQALGIGA
jgi:hypothetical protein